MLVKVLGKKLKMCRLYEDDLFGNLTIRPKKNQKFLNIIFLEQLNKDFVYKKLKKTILKFFKKYIRFIVFKINTLKRYYKSKRFNNSYIIYSFIKKDYYSKFFFHNFLRHIKTYIKIYSRIWRRKFKYYDFKSYIRNLFLLDNSHKTKTIFLYKKVNIFFLSIKKFYSFKTQLCYNFYLNLYLLDFLQISDLDIQLFFNKKEVEDYLEFKKQAEIEKENYKYLFVNRDPFFEINNYFIILLDYLRSTEHMFLSLSLSVLSLLKPKLFFQKINYNYLDDFLFQINKTLRFKTTSFFIKNFVVKSKLKFNILKKIYKVPKVLNFFEDSFFLFRVFYFNYLKANFIKYDLNKNVIKQYYKKKKNFLFYSFLKDNLLTQVIPHNMGSNLKLAFFNKKKIMTSLISGNKNFYSFFFTNKINLKFFYYYNSWFSRFFYKYNLSYYKSFLKKKNSNIKTINNKFNYRIDVGKPARKKRKKTLYWYRLLTRHRLRYFASKISVHQLKLYIRNRRSSKFFGMHFLWLLESRVDFILYRLNLQISAYHARQYIKHVGVFINEKFINIPNYKIKFNSILTFANKKASFKFLLFKFLKKIIIMSIPYYIEINHRIMSLRFFFKPRYSTVFYPFTINSNKLAALGERFK